VAEIERLRKANCVRYLAEKAENPPQPSWKAIRMAFSRPVLFAEGFRLVLQKARPWVWRARRVRLSVARSFQSGSLFSLRWF
jgi:hypothetical protein